MKVTVGDIVVRKSYNKDIFFKIVELDEGTMIAQLKGMDLRLCADAPIIDLEKPRTPEVAEYRARALKQRLEHVARASKSCKNLRGGPKTQAYAGEFVEIPGRVLHIDGDNEYLETCRSAYRDMNLPAVCEYVPEPMQPRLVVDLLEVHNPDVLVLTGHDGMVAKKNSPDNIDLYRNSRYFIDSVKKARSFQSSRDNLVIFAGACQSWYTGLMAAGANFASSPERVLIHCLDPVFIVGKIVFTPILKTVDVYDTIAGTITGLRGIGGIETRGQFRVGLPPDKKKK